jgi:hypothetical protein
MSAADEPAKIRRDAVQLYVYNLKTLYKTWIALAFPYTKPYTNDVEQQNIRRIEEMK